MPIKKERIEERVSAAHQVYIGDTKGVTRNVSASGIYFETNQPYAPGSMISFTVEFDSPGGKLALKCNGEIVRIDTKDSKVGVAVNILESVMESA